MQRTIVLGVLLNISLSTSAQDFSAILQSIDAHNTALKAARLETDAQYMETDLLNTLEDPDFGVHYLWGNHGIGNRVDLEVNQTFDFPMVYAQRKKLAQEQRRVADLQYLNERQKLLLSAHKLCIEVVYCNALMDHLEEDLVETRSLAEAYQKLYERGEATIIDRNKAHQAVLFFEAEYREFHTLRNNLIQELDCMNGGVPLNITDCAFTHTPLPADFDEWLKENLDKFPEIQLAQGEIAAKNHSLKATQSEWWPRISVGYISEKEREDHYQGMTIGVSIPLWSGKKKVKTAKAHLAAAQMAEQDTRNHRSTQLRCIYNDALQLQESYLKYQHHLTQCDNTTSLDKCLEAGQINLITYLQESQYAHEMHERLLKTERDLELRKAELQIY